MSRSAKVSLLFGDGKHDFALKIGQLEELQEKTDAGPEELYDRIGAGRWRVADIRETLRLGLIGAGMAPIEALVLVDRYADAGALAQWKTVAQSILAAALLGAPDEDRDLGEPKAGDAPPHSPAES